MLPLRLPPSLEPERLTKKAPKEHALTMPTPHTPKQNHLLAALPAMDYERLLRDLERVPLPLGWAVHEAGDKLGYVYFPTTSTSRCST